MSAQTPFTEEAILALLEADPSDPEIARRLAELRADPDAWASARSLTEVELLLSEDAFLRAEAEAKAEVGEGVAPPLPPALAQSLRDIPRGGAPRPGWFRGIFGRSPEARPGRQAAVALLALAAAVLLVVGGRSLTEQGAAPEGGVSRMKGAPEAATATDPLPPFYLIARGPDGDTRTLPLRHLRERSWQVWASPGDSVQLRILAPPDTLPGEAWRADGEIHWILPDGRSERLAGGDALTLTGEGPGAERSFAKPLNLEALAQRGFGQGHRLLFEIHREGERHSLVLRAQGGDGPP